MTPIHVHNLAAPTEGRLSFEKSPVTFGRDAGNDVLLPVKHASRQHGELRYEQGQWWLVNRSPNGTLVSGKNVTTQPRALRDRDVVSIGEQAVFEVRFSAAAPVVEPRPQAQARPRKSRRLALLLGAYFLGLMGLVAFFLTLESKREQAINAPELTDQQIADAIRRPLPSVQANPRDAIAHLQAARELYSKLDSPGDTLYRAYVEYRLALAYSGKPQFDEGLDQRRFFEVEDRLIHQVTQRYDDGYTKLRSGQYSAAESAFVELQQFYADPDSPVLQNVQKQRQVIAQKVKKRRR